MSVKKLSTNIAIEAAECWQIYTPSYTCRKQPVQRHKK